jgi:hypothetical protein
MSVPEIVDSELMITALYVPMIIKRPIPKIDSDFFLTSNMLIKLSLAHRRAIGVPRKDGSRSVLSGEGLESTNKR